MTWADLVKRGREILKEQGIENAAYDARDLLLCAADLDLSAYLLKMREEADGDLSDRYLEWIKRRAKHEPLQYITGRAYFYGRTFGVRPGVLIPRYDTETLIEAVLPDLKENQRILDLCCGSGCILLTLLAEGPASSTGLAADLSDTALAVTEDNMKRLNLAGRAKTRKSDLFEEISENFDLIVSNPPYIPSDVVEMLAPEVRDFEPHLALDGEEDGLAFYRRIVREAPAHLNSGGMLAFEIGYDQGPAVKQLMEEEDFEEVRVIRDLSDKDRVAAGRRK
jgi:release factor glutamine methyltransferase